LTEEPKTKKKKTTLIPEKRREERGPKIIRAFGNLIWNKRTS